MELRDYLRMLRHGWPAVVAITLLCFGLAGLYLALAPKTYQATSLVYVSARGANSVGDLQLGGQFSQRAAMTYAEMVKAPVILDPVIRELRLRATPAELSGLLTVAVRSETALIEITVSTPSPRQAAAVANAVASTMGEVIPELERGGASGEGPVRLSTVQEAAEPTEAASPNTRRVLALGLVVGLATGLALTIAVQSLDTRIRHSRDFWDLTDAPLLAAIPHVRGAKKNALVTRDHASGPLAEAFRTLRTNIRFLEKSEPRSFVVTAVADHDSGPYTAANLAWAIAEAGSRVLLIDADLRHPHLGQIMGLSSDDGLSDVLAGHIPLPDALLPTDHPRLMVILSGTRPPNPSELIGSPAMRELLTSVQSDFDYVILHAPPLLSYTDPAVLAVEAGRTIVTIAAGRTRTDQFSAALLTLKNVGLEPMGIVMCGVRPASVRPEEYIRPADPKKEHHERAGTRKELVAEPALVERNT